jgi:hypothetical protein
MLLPKYFSGKMVRVQYLLSKGKKVFCVIYIWKGVIYEDGKRGL